MTLNLQRIFIEFVFLPNLRLETLRTLLVHPIDMTGPNEGVYTIDCARCPKKYVGETKRKLKVRVKEHGTEIEEVNNRIYRKRQSVNRDVEISHHRSCYKRKSLN